MSAPSINADIVIIGGGPAGCAAALMAASLDLRSVLVEPEQLGGRLHSIGALANVPGAWSTGPSLADAVAIDVRRIQDSGHCHVLRGRAIEVRADNWAATVVLTDGSLVTAGTAIVATGVVPVTASQADWISAPASLAAAPLWRTRPADLIGRTCVLGGDRPLGTWLRSHPEAHRDLLVLHPPADDYKVAEVETDLRVHLRRAAQIDIKVAASGGYQIDVHAPDGSRSAYVCDTLLTNLGNRPASIPGLTTDVEGYCPPEAQPQRIITAGDLRSSRFQRIVTAQGSGAHAVLASYYAAAL